MKQEMTQEHKMYFFYGYCRRSAELLKEEGCFPELTLDEIIVKLLEGLNK